MTHENGTYSTNDVTRTAVIILEASGGSPDTAIARAERQVETSQVKHFALAVLVEVKRLCADLIRKH